MVAQQLTKLGFELADTSPEQFAVFLRDENTKCEGSEPAG